MWWVLPKRLDADAVSEMLYDLSRPDSKAKPDDGTIYWERVIGHSDGRAAMRVKDLSDAHIDPDADADALADKIGLKGAAKRTFTDAIEQLKGGRHTLLDIIPQQIQDTFLTDAEMEADGWPINVV